MFANPRSGFQVSYAVHFDTGWFLTQLEVDDGRAGLRQLQVGDRYWVLLFKICRWSR